MKTKEVHIRLEENYLNMLDEMAGILLKRYYISHGVMPTRTIVIKRAIKAYYDQLNSSFEEDKMTKTLQETLDPMLEEQTKQFKKEMRKLLQEFQSMEERKRASTSDSSNSSYFDIYSYLNDTDED